MSDFGPGEREYIRLTTVGMIDTILATTSRIKFNLDVLGMKDEAMVLGHADEALYSAVEKLRSEGQDE